MARLFTAFKNTTDTGSMAGLGGFLPGMQAGAKMVREGERHAQQLELGQREIELADAKAAELKTQQETQKILQQSMLGDIPGLLADGEKVFGDASLNLDRSDLDSFKLLWTARQGALAEGASTAAYDRALQLKFGALEQQVRGARTQQSRNSAIRFITESITNSGQVIDDAYLAELEDASPATLSRLSANWERLSEGQRGIDSLKSSLLKEAEQWNPPTELGRAAKDSFVLAMQAPIPTRYTDPITRAEMIIDTPEEVQLYIRAMFNKHLIETLPAEIQAAIEKGSISDDVGEGAMAALAGTRERMTDIFGRDHQGAAAAQGTGGGLQGRVDEDPIDAALNLGAAGEGDGEVAAEPAAELTVEPEAQLDSAAIGGESQKSSGDQDDYYLDEDGKLITSFDLGGRMNSDLTVPGNQLAGRAGVHIPGTLSDDPDTRLEQLNKHLVNLNEHLEPMLKVDWSNEQKRPDWIYTDQEKHEDQIAEVNKSVAATKAEISRLEPLIASRDAKATAEYRDEVATRTDLRPTSTGEAQSASDAMTWLDTELDPLIQGYGMRLKRARQRAGPRSYIRPLTKKELAEAERLLHGSTDNPNVPKFESPEDARRYEVLMERKRELGWVDPNAPASVAAAPSGELYKIEGMDFPDPSDATAWDNDRWVQAKHMAMLDDKIIELEGELGTIKGRGMAARKRKIQNEIKALKDQREALVERYKSANK